MKFTKCYDEGDRKAKAAMKDWLSPDELQEIKNAYFAKYPVNEGASVNYSYQFPTEIVVKQGYGVNPEYRTVEDLKAELGIGRDSVEYIVDSEYLDFMRHVYAR